MHRSIILLDNPDPDTSLSPWEQLKTISLNNVKFFQTQTVQEALAFLIAIKADLLLVGPNLEEEVTLRFIRQIKADARHSHLPILLIANPEEPAQRWNQALKTGADDLIFQPFSEQELQIRLKKALESPPKSTRTREKGPPQRSSREIVADIQPDLERILSLAKVGIWEYNSSTDRIYWSQEVYNFLGYNPDEISPEPDLFKKHLHPEDRKQTEKALERFQETGNLDLTLRFIRTDREVRFAHIQGILYPQADGQHRALGIFQDVTQTKRVENKLSELLEYSQRKSKETTALLHGTRSILEYSDLETVANCLLDHCLSLVSCQAGAVYFWAQNRHAQRNCLAQRGRTELLQAPSKQWEDLLQEVQIQKKSQQTETQELVADNAQHKIHFLCSPLIINEQVTGVLYLASENASFAAHHLRMVSAFAELMSIALFNKRNLESLHKMAAALEQSGESVCITDENKTIEYVNSKFEETTGYACEQIKGQPAANFYPKSKFDRLNNKESISRGQKQSKTKSGAQYTEDFTISSVISPQGKTQNYVIISRDVTEKLLMEEKLRQAQKMEAIGTLAGGIAHDFNNLLMPIQGYLEMALLQLSANSKIYDYLCTALLSSQRAKDLVHQILIFSRNETPEKQFLHLESIVKETLKMMQASLPENVQLKSSIEPCLKSVLAEPGQIHQLLINLCTNAGHAMHETGGTLEVSLRSEEILADTALTNSNLPPGSYICLTVSDSGHGMQSETKQRIFEPFFTTKGPDEGTGMGLSVVHGIVKEIEGDIWVQSAPGQGTQFKILLPAQDTEVQAKAVTREVPDLGKGHILFVDDDPSITAWAKCSLERLGYKVTPTNSPTEALQLFEDAPENFDLVVTDQIMPEMNGTQLIYNIRALNQNTPVILCSGFNIAPLNTESLKIQGQLSKPFSMGEFSKLLKKCLSPKQIEYSTLKTSDKQESMT
jgi:PAS domain S-box-containing protein